MRTSSSFFELKPCGSESGIPLSQTSQQCTVLLDFFGPAQRYQSNIGKRSEGNHARVGGLASKNASRCAVSA
jgi:hypothetical protein